MSGPIRPNQLDRIRAGHPVSGASEAYLTGVAEQDRLLQERLSALRNREDTREVTVAEAASLRIDILTGHLERCRRLRAEYLGEQA